MPRQYFSPYAPRRRRSARLVAVWLATFLFVLWMTWYVTSRQRERAVPYVDEFLARPGARRAVVVDDTAAAGAGAGGNARGVPGRGEGSGSV